MYFKYFSKHIDAKWCQHISMTPNAKSFNHPQNSQLHSIPPSKSIPKPPITPLQRMHQREYDHRWSIVWIDHSQGAALLELPPGLHLTAFRRWNSETGWDGPNLFSNTLAVDDNEGWGQNVLDCRLSFQTDSWKLTLDWFLFLASSWKHAKGQAKYSKVGYESGTYGCPNGVQYVQSRFEYVRIEAKDHLILPREKQSCQAMQLKAICSSFV